MKKDIEGKNLPKIGYIPDNIAPTPKPKKAEAIENMQTKFRT